MFQGVVGGAAGTKIRLYIILEKSKETILEFTKGTAEVLYYWLNIINVQLSNMQLKKLLSRIKQGQLSE